MCPTLATSAVAVKSPTPGTSKQPLRSRVVGRKGRELLFHRLNAGFELAELRVDESQGGAQVDRAAEAPRLRAAAGAASGRSAPPGTA